VALGGDQIDRRYSTGLLTNATADAKNYATVDVVTGRVSSGYARNARMGYSLGGNEKRTLDGFVDDLTRGLE
jgi:hypothetical protein